MDGYRLHQGCGSYGTLAHNVTREDPLGTAVPVVLLFFSDQHLSAVKNMCINTYTSKYTHVWLERLYMNYRCHQITLRVKYFLKKFGSGAKCCLDIYHWGTCPAGDWANTWHWTKHFTVFFFKKEAVAAPFTATFSSLSHFSRSSLLETACNIIIPLKIVKYYCNMH